MKDRRSPHLTEGRCSFSAVWKPLLKVHAILTAPYQVCLIWSTCYNYWVAFILFSAPLRFSSCPQPTMAPPLTKIAQCLGHCSFDLVTDSHRNKVLRFTLQNTSNFGVFFTYNCLILKRPSR